MKNKMHMTRKTKDEKRRLAFEKRNVKKEMNLARYGAEGGSALVMAKTTDFNRRFVAAMLALVFVISCLVVGFSFVGRANGNIANLTPGKVVDTDSGMVLNKYLTPTANGDYDLTLEAYSTADMKTITEKIPTDFVVVVDQSGSMDTPDMPTGTPTVRNNINIEDIAEGAYYYREPVIDPETGNQAVNPETGNLEFNYYRVYGVKDYLYSYNAPNSWYVGDIVKRLNTRLRWFMSDREATTNFENQMYFREVVDGKTYYQPITMTIKGVVGTYDVRFKYFSKENNQETWFDRTDSTYMNGRRAPWYKNLAGGGLIDDTWGINIAGRQIGYPQIDWAVQTAYPSDQQYCHSTFTLINPIPVLLPDGWKLETGMYINYPFYFRHVGYTKLCYRDIDGVEHELPSDNNSQSEWEYCQETETGAVQTITTNDGNTRPTYSGLYTFPTTSDRLSALKVALGRFAQAVAKEEDSFGAVDNRISIVGFSSPGYNNTELLTNTRDDFSLTPGGYISKEYPINYNGVSKSAADAPNSGWYENALVNACDTNEGGTPQFGDVNDDITEAINALTPYGGTQPEDGLYMAHQILTKRSNKTYTIRSGENKDQVVDRNTVVIFFTDGQPGNYQYSNQYSEANEVVAQAKDIKDYKDTSIFTIGVFGESDGNPLTYDASNEYTTDPSTGNPVLIGNMDPAYWEYLDGWMESYPENNPQYCLRRQWRPSSTGYTEKPNDTIFDYMSVTSSNYPDAENYIAPAWLSGSITGDYVAATDGVRHKESAEETNKYYRMASNQDTLVKAFLQAVSMDSQETSKEIKMDSNAELKDVIDLSNFDLPQTPTATVQTATYTLSSPTDTIEDNRWTKPVDSALLPVWNENKDQVTISGFDYSKNYVAWDKPATDDLDANTGRKLIVTIHGVKPKTDITSSSTNTLYSNTSDASITSGDGKTTVSFPMPSITRHSYEMHVSGDDADKASFNVVPSLTGGTISTEDVILVTPTERIKYSKYVADGKPAFSMSDGDKFYFENVPSDYKVNTSITSTDGNYTYTWTDNSNTTLDQTTAQSQPYDYVNSDIYIDSKANTRSASLTLNTEGEYANKKRQFPIGMTIEKNDGTKFEGNITLGDNTTLSFTDGSLTNPDSLKLKDGDTVEFTNLPANSTVTITPSDDPGNAYTWTTRLDEGEVTNTAKTGTIDQDGHVFHVVYTRGTVTETGVTDDSSNSFIYILAGAGALSAGAGAAYVYRKKDEFVER